MDAPKQTVGVIFGSRSVEHDVSIVTAHQIMNAMNPARYEIVPIYITRDGRWMSGPGLRDIQNFQLDEISDLATVYEVLFSSSTRYPGIIRPPLSGRFGRSRFRRIDVAFCAVHGTHGEDGTLQGLLEMADVPYIGTGVLASAIGNHKGVAKALWKQRGIPVLDGITFSRREWLANSQAILEQVVEQGYPAFVKPATLGSSIGIARIENDEQARLHIDIAASFAQEVLVERAVVGGVEINCSVMGNYEMQASVLEQPLSGEVFLTYDEKYMRGEGVKSAGMKSADRLIPAPISEELTARIQDLAKRAFAAIEGRGIARVDFLMKPETGDVWLNEINTMPGSLSFYLWKASGKEPAAVVDELIRLGLELHAEKRRTTFDYRSELLELAATRTLSGVKK
jgi:D-alanine-D-alanine ligase